MFGLVVSLGVLGCDLCFGRGLLSLAWFSFEGWLGGARIEVIFYPRKNHHAALPPTLLPPFPGTFRHVHRRAKISIAANRPLAPKIRRKAEAITGDSQMTMEFVLIHSYIVLDLLEMLGKSKDDSPNSMALAMVQSKKRHLKQIQVVQSYSWLRIKFRCFFSSCRRTCLKQGRFNSSNVQNKRFCLHDAIFSGTNN